MPAPIAALGLTLILALSASPAFGRPGCPPAGFDRAALADLKTKEWRIDNDAARAGFARAVVACLASSDPEMRDGVAYEALQAMLRGKSLDTATMNALYTDLKAMLDGPDGKGFARPFAALVLAEIARADRIEPYLAPERRAELLKTATGYLVSVDDYRGFDDKEGWRHGVAHGADLLLQLALNPAFGKDELTQIRDAVATQIAPDRHSYIFGESERLARPILYAAQRDVFSEAEWTAFFESISAFESDPYKSSAGLARRHNLMAFLSALHINVTLGENTADDALRPGLDAALRALP